MRMRRCKLRAELRRGPFSGVLGVHSNIGDVTLAPCPRKTESSLTVACHLRGSHQCGILCMRLQVT